MSEPEGVRARIGWRLRCWADRIDRPGAPKAMSVRFTFEDRTGIVFRDDGRGCLLWYYGDADYERAHNEAGPVTGERSTAWLPRRRDPRYAALDAMTPEDFTRKRRELLEYTERNGGLMSPSALAELAQIRAEGEQR